MVVTPLYLTENILALPAASVGCVYALGFRNHELNERGQLPSGSDTDGFRGFGSERFNRLTRPVEPIETRGLI
jgi:hypothetical protein